MESLEDARARHSKEKKELRNKITSKKKQATKKNRKGVNSECDELETSLRLRQEAELSAITGQGDYVADEKEEEETEGERDAVAAGRDPNAPRAETDVEAVTDGISKANLDGSEGDDASGIASMGTGGGAGKKKNRQKERLARRAAEQEAEAVRAEEEALKMPNWKKQERAGMLKAFAEHDLVEEEIRPDGHCLFSAVADQLTQAGIPLGQGGAGPKEGYKIVRKTAADYMESHKEDFEGFMEVPLTIYAYKIRETAEWGGHLEVTALARSYGVQIAVVQNTRIDTFGPTEVADDMQKIWLAYYLHGYGLGEHYNSLRKAP